MTSISTKYVNRSTVTIDVNNVRNPQIKKIVRKLDLFFGDIYFNLSKKKQDEFYSQNLEKYNKMLKYVANGIDGKSCQNIYNECMKIN